HRRRKNTDSRHIGASQFIGKAVAVDVGVYTEALCRLDAVVMVESCVGKIAQRNTVGRLVKWPDDEARRGLGGRMREGFGGEAVFLRRGPRALGLCRRR